MVESQTYTVAVYQSDAAPEHLRAIARIILPGGQAHPVIFEGRTLDDVHARATAWWDRELAAAKLRTGLSDEQIAAMQAGRRRAREARKTKSQEPQP